MELTDQIALVTGAGQGIGKGTALALARDGAHVAVVDINGQAAETTSSEIMANGSPESGPAGRRRQPARH